MKATASAANAAEKHLTVATASMGDGIAEVVTKYVPDLKVAAEVTGGP